MNHSITQQWRDIATQAVMAAKITRTLSTQQKNKTLQILAKTIHKQQARILKANRVDLEGAKDQQLSSVLIERLSLDERKIKQMIMGIEQVIELPDPVGEVSHMSYRPSGIRVGKMRSPLGVIAIIYESRPNVTLDASILCFKSGNACILRGGSEAIHSNIAIYRCFQHALTEMTLDIHCVQFLEQTDRQFIKLMGESPEYIDMIIPRGGEGLIRAVCDHSRVAVLKHLHGICHTYIEKSADIEMAENIAYNAKTRRYGVCNAMETLLVDEAIATRYLPLIGQRYQEAGVELRGCEKTCQIIPVNQASEDDWHTEYLDAILSIKVVSNIDEAIAHINHYGSAHSDAIVTSCLNEADKFMKEVDSSSVLVNTSTAFADGFEYGLGGEIGISTDKLHARGPIGLQGLTNEKYIVLGQGETRPA